MITSQFYTYVVWSNIMKPSARAATFAAVLLASAGPALAEDDASPKMSMEAQKSFACLAAGTAGTVAALSAGVVLPATSAAVTFGILGVVFAGFCNVGESLAPAVLYLVDHAPPVVAQAGGISMAAAAAGYESMVSAARASWTALGETQMPDLEAAAGAIAHAGWSSFGGLCLRLAVCQARVVAPLGNEDAGPDLVPR